MLFRRGDEGIEKGERTLGNSQRGVNSRQCKRL